MNKVAVLLLVSTQFVGFSAAADTLFSSRASGEVAVTRAPSDARVRLVRAAPNGDLWPARGIETPEARAADFLARHSNALALRDAAGELRAAPAARDAYGFTRLRYVQELDGLPVFGAGAVVMFSPDGRMTSVSAGLVDTTAVKTTPYLTAEQAAAIATDAQPLEKPRLLVYSALTPVGGRQPARLAWEVLVGDGERVRDFVYVDALGGKVLDRFSAIEHAINRSVHDGGFGEGFLVWREGDPQPFGVQDVDNILKFSEDTYNLVASISGGQFLSWDNEDGTMHSITHPPGMSCPNASWNGLAARFCPGYTGDDVVSHEFIHGYTDATHDLIYRWQSGALNEAYSDIFGEVVDILNGEGIDAPHEPRLENACSTFGGLLPPLVINEPAELAGRYAGGDATFNPPGLTPQGMLAVVDDGVDEPTDACTAVTNGDELQGKIALVENRGRCAGLTQVLNAQAGGAIAVVYVNTFSDVYYGLSGNNSSIEIPTVIIGRTLGQALVDNIDTAVVTVEVRESVDPSLRWLHREDFNFFAGTAGSNRDMWNPNCYGDPGRVTDPLYYCGSGDSGGVHYNSGIVNHLFARLVDGGTYNGTALEPIGLTKATHLYWRAMTNYQVPDSDFAHHADALEASCADLSGAGVTLWTPDTEAPAAVMSDLVISPADCAALSAAISAVELRLPPSQCEFEPLLAQAPPPLCEPGYAADDVYFENFESGGDGWQAGTRQLLDPSTFDTPDWAVVSDLPQGRAGSAAFVADLIIGNCANDSEAGVLYYDSPLIELPASLDAPVLSFVHSVATESLWDGGNVKLSVNKGKFNLVPESAYRYNTYTGTLNPGDNPLGGEPAWFGSDGNSLSGTWGQSQIDLAGVAGPGDSVQVRFDFGIDGCNGLKGWFVDDVRITRCEAADSDGDEVFDLQDNCTLVANADQRDTNADGFGNACDADLDNDCAVAFGDLGLMKAAFFQGKTTPGWNEDADLNGDGAINFGDLAILRSQFFSSPGPSGVTTACN
ncbi:MAG: M4 family metallopeptidase [Pseudomonadota bacterium]